MGGYRNVYDVVKSINSAAEDFAEQHPDCSEIEVEFCDGGFYIVGEDDD